MSTVLLLPAAGSGTRLAAGAPKAFVHLAGRPLLAHAVEGAVRSGVIDAIVIAAPSSLLEDARRIAETAAEAPVGSPVGLDGPVDPDGPVDSVRPGDPDVPGAPARPAPVPITVVEGGADRVVSVAAALAAVPQADLVLVHDAARCLTPASVYHRVVAALKAGASAVVPVLPMTDTVKTTTDAGTVVGDLDRTALRRVQTPQGFVREALIAAHGLQRTDPDRSATDDAGLVERLDIAVVGVPGDEAALKITHPIDLRVAELYVSDGHDAHRRSE
ncbi:2-C-methyl-D-erythritol 4-phosphate cytidylyltransferase [Brevibacterium jeotgali]|uniref:2-C-methyl-D-erythritol 4-phosphate cytidylyltransferase n=2 Tax=Brevibacterium jeotgali TaxID=1262550 RepID=A0A2H1L490_9MICO|nr:2-C-methyl-D-erythritol 4-phosphate cytidylyltransferase [Brevibacterium jeotgali]SMY11711.1 2-C-methyl-D-erythritol 4-phosphate cytidylyltransferase [Brevibacterium jeotgali]